MLALYAKHGSMHQPIHKSSELLSCNRQRKISKKFANQTAHGILKLQNLEFDNMDSHYFEFFGRFCPFIQELHLIDSVLKIHHLLKLLELTTCLEVFLFSGCRQLAQLPGLFPLDYDCEAKNQVVKNLSGVKTIAFEYFNNIPLIADLVRCATNLNNFKMSIWISELDGHVDPYKEFFTIFNNYNAGKLTHLNLNLDFYDNVDEFITNFVKIKNLNLKSFTLMLRWNWSDGVYKSSVFRQLILKLHSLIEFIIDDELRQDQLALICQHLVNLKSLDCLLLNDNLSIAELVNLKHLEKLRCRFSQNTHTCSAELDNFFKCKFDNLRIFKFQGFVTESNLLQLCENNPNLIELRLTRLLTRNLEIIFKHLIKLRVLTIYFGFARLRPKLKRSDVDMLLFDSNREYEYKISRLQNLEEFYLNELVNGICEDDVQQLKKLRSTNVQKLFGKQTDLLNIF